MRLILDSNIIISALIRDSKSREIILKSGFEFYHPKIALENLEKHKEELIKKAGISNGEFEEIYQILLNNIFLLEKEYFLDKMKEAKAIIGHIDIEDVPFIALALSMPNDGIWSDDKHFEKQDRIKIWKTEEILRKVKENFES